VSRAKQRLGSRPLTEVAVSSHSALSPKRRSAHSGDRTRDNIMAACRDILVTKGHSVLTMRRVAALAGVTHGNLAYHYPSKRALLRAFINSLVAEYSIAMEEYFKEIASSETRGFVGLVNWFIDDSVDKRTGRLFRELWALSLLDRYVAEAVTGLYEGAFDRAIDLLRKEYPAVPEAKAREIVYFMGLITEGANVMFGVGTNRAASLDGVRAMAIRALMNCVAEIDPVAREKVAQALKGFRAAP
jgi:AcrR family transcriptional regulator